MIRENKTKRASILAQNFVPEVVYKDEELAVSADISKLFQSYAKCFDGKSSSSPASSNVDEQCYSDNGVAFINVMQFSTILRIATAEKGNLFKEMQMFNKYVFFKLLLIDC